MKLKLPPRRYILTLALLLFANLGLYAHPHVFIDAKIQPRFSLQNAELLGITVEWHFDPIYSAQMIADFDKDRSRDLSPAEVEEIRTTAFLHLKEFNYFFNFHSRRNASAQIPIAAPRDFTARIVKQSLVYQFYLPINMEVQFSTEYRMYFEDPEYFIAFQSILQPSMNPQGVSLETRSLMVSNEIWGSYPVEAIIMRRN